MTDPTQAATEAVAKALEAFAAEFRTEHKHLAGAWAAGEPINPVAFEAEIGDGLTDRFAAAAVSALTALDWQPKAQTAESMRTHLLAGLEVIDRDDHWGTLVDPDTVAELIEDATREIGGQP